MDLQIGEQCVSERMMEAGTTVRRNTVGNQSIKKALSLDEGRKMHEPQACQACMARI